MYILDRYVMFVGVCRYIIGLHRDACNEHKTMREGNKKPSMDWFQKNRKRFGLGSMFFRVSDCLIHWKGHILSRRNPLGVTNSCCPQRCPLFAAGLWYLMRRLNLQQALRPYAIHGMLNSSYEIGHSFPIYRWFYHRDPQDKSSSPQPWCGDPGQTWSGPGKKWSIMLQNSKSFTLRWMNKDLEP